MKRAVVTQFLVAGLMLTAPTLARAETHATVKNGATCIPYPNESYVGIAYLSWLWGFRDMATCHVEIPNGWSVNQLSYMLYTVSQDGASPMTISLCVANPYGGAHACGSPRTTTPGLNINWVAPPAPMPAAAGVAYLVIRFPHGEYSRVLQVIPVFYRP